MSLPIAAEMVASQNRATGSARDRDRQQGAFMKAIVQDAYGSTDVLELRDIDKPEMADGEVLLRVHAAGIDRGCGFS